MSIVTVDAIQWFEWYQWEDAQGVVHDVTRIGLASVIHRVRCTGFLKERTPYTPKPTTCLGCVAQRGEASMDFSKVTSVVVNAKVMAGLRQQYVEDQKVRWPSLVEEVRRALDEPDE
jgi:hypothetical protein